MTFVHTIYNMPNHKAVNYLLKNNQCKWKHQAL